MRSFASAQINRKAAPNARGTGQNERRIPQGHRRTRSLRSGLGKGAMEILLGASGFTLAEVVVSVGILTMASGLVGSSVFQVLAIERSWRDDVVATRMLRHADSWFASDALNAEETDLADGEPPASSVTLSWKDVGGARHTAVYSLSPENSLVRRFDDMSMTVAERVVSTGFSLAGNILTFDLKVEAGEGETKAMSLQTSLRSIGPF